MLTNQSISIVILLISTRFLTGYIFLHFIMKQVCHRDLKLENTLLDGSPAPRLKICDFGYSKVCDSLSLSLSLHVPLPSFYRSRVLNYDRSLVIKLKTKMYPENH